MFCFEQAEAMYCANCTRIRQSNALGCCFCFKAFLYMDKNDSFIVCINILFQVTSTRKVFKGTYTCDATT